MIVSDAQAAKAIIEAAQLEPLVVGFDNDNTKTEEAVVNALKVILEEMTTNVAITPHLATALPFDSASSFSSTGIDFRLVINGDDSSSIVFADQFIKRVNVAVTSHVKTANDSIGGTISESLQVSYAGDRDQTVAAVQNELKDYLEGFLSNVSVKSVTWSSPPSTINGPLGEAQYNFVVNIEGADGSSLSNPFVVRVQITE